MVSILLALAAINPTMSVLTPAGQVEVTPVTPEIFRVTVLPSDSAVSYLSSQSAVLPQQPLGKHSTVVTPAAHTLLTPTTQVSVDHRTGAVSFFDNANNLLLREAIPLDNNADTKRIAFLAEGTGLLYGAGERGHRPILNGDTLSMYNTQNYGYTASDPRIAQMGISVPYFASDKGFGVLFDDFNRASLTLGNDTISYSSDTPHAISYYFINAPEKNLAGVAGRYSSLTGLQPLPPLWTLGYITSKYGYKDRAETDSVVNTLKSRGYPLDGIVLDLYWYGTETDMGRLEWNPQQWPDHADMLKNLKDKGVNTVLISQPYLNKIGAIDNYNLLASKGMLVRDADGNTHDVTTWVGDAGMLDVSNPLTRQWLWNRLSSLTADGVAGWWGDLGEPEVHPLTMYHANGMTAPEYHNVYGNEWSRLIYEGLRKDYPDSRPLLMMRGGTAGLQRYGVMPWTTDVSRSWGGFKPQINLMLSSGISGLGYMSSDIGGFAVDAKKPTDPELYTRWLQMGVFTPMLRTHSTVDAEPYRYPQQEKILKDFIKMRYQWLPYNYSLAYENALAGLPLARPLNFYGDNPGLQFANVDDEYLWGRDVLVAPVMTQGARSRKVLFPAGEWVSWFNPAKRFAGGREYTVQAPLHQIPLFVRAGSFIPQAQGEMENTSQYNPAILSVLYFPAKEKSSYTMYEDDFKDPEAIAANRYATLTFEGEKSGNTISVTITPAGSYPGMPESRRITLEIPGVAKPSSVSIDGNRCQAFPNTRQIRQYGYSYNPAKRTLSVILPLGSNPSSIEIK